MAEGKRSETEEVRRETKKEQATFSVELLLSKYKTKLAEMEQAEQNHAEQMNNLQAQKQQINKQIEETVGQYNAVQGAKNILSAQIAELQPDG